MFSTLRPIRGSSLHVVSDDTTMMLRQHRWRRAVFVSSLAALVIFLSAVHIFSDSRRLESAMGRFSLQPHESVALRNNSSLWQSEDPLLNNQTTRDINETKRKYFVLHLGPPKTATTSLQMDLRKYKQTYLSLDNYTYEGIYIEENGNDYGSTLLNALTDRKCQAAVFEARTNQREIPPCWQAFENELERFKGKSIVLSFEALSFKWYRFGSQVSPLDWVALQELLDRHNYELITVLTYRRLYELLPSETQQQDRWRPSKPKLNKWPGTMGGRALEPLFPKILQHPLVVANDTLVQKSISFVSPLESSLEMLRSHNVTEVRILNLYAEKSVTNTFLCDILPTAHHSCRLSVLQADQEETRANTEQSRFYDALVTAAAAAGWVNATQHKRHDVVVATQSYHQDILNRTARDFTVLCPAKADLEMLLQASLRREAALMPQLHAAQELHHVESFWEAVERNKYCWIDTNATLQLDEWKVFFSRFE